MTSIDKIKETIAQTKTKISELDLLISKINGMRDRAKLTDNHIPVDGQPFVYQFLDPIDKQPGILIPGVTTSLLGTRPDDESIFSGRLQIDSDSSFVCHDIQAVPQIDWQDEDSLNTPAAGKFWGPLALSDLGQRYQVLDAATSPLFGSDFGFRFTDEGTGRRLFQASINSQVDNNFIPGRFLGSGIPFLPFGANYTQPLPYKHIFAKNTAVRVDLKIYNSCESNEELDTPISANDIRMFICLIGYKVYGD